MDRPQAWQLPGKTFRGRWCWQCGRYSRPHYSASQTRLPCWLRDSVSGDVDGSSSCSIIRSNIEVYREILSSDVDGTERSLHWTLLVFPAHGESFSPVFGTRGRIPTYSTTSTYHNMIGRTLISTYAKYENETGKKPSKLTITLTITILSSGTLMSVNNGAK